MKRMALMAFVFAVIAGCSSVSSVNWQQSSQVKINQVNIELKSNLWVSLMPTLEESQEQSIQGALYLEGDQLLPANLTIESLVIKQGKREWRVSEDGLETRTHNENQWEVAFTSQIEADTEKTVDIAVLLDDEGKQLWLVETAVKINKVY